MSLTFIPLSRSSPCLSEADRIFTDSFPSRTQISVDDFLRLQDAGLLDYRAILDDEDVIGFYNVLLSEHIAYLFFFAIRPDCRSRGYGSRVLTLLEKEYPGRVPVLDMEEVDPDADNYLQRCRRRDFYEKNGYADSGCTITYYGGTFTLMAKGSFSLEELSDLMRRINLDGFSPVLSRPEPVNLETSRLLLRPWRESDAPVLYELAQDPEIGPRAGWPVHTSAEQSLEVIRTVLSRPETYAVILKEDGEDRPSGCVGIKFAEDSDLAESSSDTELGCWIGKAYWGREIIPEALRVLIHRCFQELGVTRIWYGYYEGNNASRRVAEKCGFVFHHTVADAPVPLLNTRKTLHALVLDRSDYEK